MKSLGTRLSFIAAGLLALTSSLYAAEGVLLVERTTIGGETRTSRIRIEPQRIRAEVAGIGSGQQVFIFDGANEVLRVLNEADRTYTEMTQADVERMSTQMSAMMAEMQEQLKNLPPAQRAQIEAMMKGRGGQGMPGMGGDAPQIEYTRTGTDRVGDWMCTTYEGFVNGEKVSELCTVEPSALGFAEADFAVTRELAEFFGALMPQNAGAMFRIGADDLGFSGVPVRRIAFAGPEPVTTELVEASRETFSDDLFTVPAGYERRTTPGMPFGPPRR